MLSALVVGIVVEVEVFAADLKALTTCKALIFER
jgi:hypothetical protein